MNDEIEIFKKDEFIFKIPARMQYLRIHKFITQKDMSERLGVSKTYISNLERGQTKLPAKILLAYCRILVVSPNYMLGYEEGESLLPERYRLLSENNRKLINDLIVALSDTKK